jgi:cobalt transporter subunit CbtB
MSTLFGATTLPRSRTLAPLLLIVLGLFLLAVVGFGQGEMLHEFVHDARHLAAFPCH